jgi:hypothetical protein
MQEGTRLWRESGSGRQKAAWDRAISNMVIEFSE